MGRPRVRDIWKRTPLCSHPLRQEARGANNPWQMCKFASRSRHSFQPLRRRKHQFAGPVVLGPYAPPFACSSYARSWYGRT